MSSICETFKPFGQASPKLAGHDLLSLTPSPGFRSAHAAATVRGMDIKAIPTLYRGVTFRSRLEARWAAFFDLAGFGWDYEPIDLDGWCPDFRIDTTVGSVFAEIKPVPLRALDPPTLRSRTLPSDDSFDKARKHWRHVWVLLLGAEPQDDSDYFAIGSLMDAPEDTEVEWHDMSKALGVGNQTALWRQAGARVQWKPPTEAR